MKQGMAAKPAKPNPNPNRKGIEMKMESSTLRAHLEEECFSSAPTSPVENNHHRGESPSPPRPPLSSGSAPENPVENNNHRVLKSSPPPPPPPRSPPPPPPPRSPVTYGSAPGNPVDNNNQRVLKSSPPPRSPVTYGSAPGNPVDNNNQRVLKSSPPPRSPVSYGSAHENLAENNNQWEKSSQENPPVQNNLREKSSPPLPISKAIVPADRYSLEHGSLPLLPGKEFLPPRETQSQPQQRNSGSPPVVVVNRSMRDEMAVVTKVDPGGAGVVDGFGTGHGHGHGAEVGGGNRGDRGSRNLKGTRSSSDATLKRVALAIRVCEVVFCLISFSVMGADKTRGWAGDSFDRYKEYRYCISMNILGFVYAGFQAATLITAKPILRYPLRSQLDFSIDQIMTYLLISASSSAATRVDDWVSNWGKDEFTTMASASIAMSFLAFFCFATSSLISGYFLLSARNFT